MQTIKYKRIDIVGITDTCIKAREAKFALKNYQSTYQAYWSPSEQSYTSGVGLLISNEYAKYVQKVVSWKGRIIYTDLYTAGNKKTRIINTYVPPIHKGDSKHANIQK